MANVELQSDVHEPPRERTARTHRPIGGTIESIASIGAIVLSILALAGLLVAPFTAIAVIAAGAAVLFEASGMSRRAHAQGMEHARGVGADSIAGIGAIVLGILSLIGLAPLVLGPIAAIILGAGLLLSANAPGLEPEGAYGRTYTREQPRFLAASSVHVLVGAGAVVLGILGVLGLAPGVLTAISMLAIGSGLLLSETAIGGHLTGMFHHGT